MSEGLNKTKTEENIQLNRLIIEASKNMKPFIEGAIEDGKLEIFGSHGHLGYKDDKFWGHYISPTKDGVRVTVYLKDEIKGDPMNIDGERGRPFFVDIPLDKKFRQKMLEKIIKEMQENEKRIETEKNASLASSLSEYLNEADETVKILESGLKDGEK